MSRCFGKLVLELTKSLFCLSICLDTLFFNFFTSPSLTSDKSCIVNFGAKKRCFTKVDTFKYSTRKRIYVLENKLARFCNIYIIFIFFPKLEITEY